MIDQREDQAAGLRRLFRRAPPVVVAMYTTGKGRPDRALYTAHRIAGQAERVLLIDEAIGEDALSHVLGLSAGNDLLKVLDGHLTLAEVLQPVPGLMGRVPAAAAALALPLLDDERRACLVEGLRRLYRHAGFVLIHASLASADDPSPFIYAAPRRLIVAEVSASGATQAYQLIKKLAVAGVGSVSIAVSGARSRQEASAFFSSLEKLVHVHVGMALAWLGEVERDDLATALSSRHVLSSPHESELAFMRQLRMSGGHHVVRPVR